jgi:gamma-tubulin complex component 3
MDLIAKICEVGFLYRRIQQFLNSNDRDESRGLIRQSFCAGLHQEQREFFELIASLENHLSKEETTHFVTKGLSIKRLNVWITEPLQKLRFFAVLIDATEGNNNSIISWVNAGQIANVYWLLSLQCVWIITLYKGVKGGALLSIIYSYVNHGDPFVRKIIDKLMNEVSMSTTNP